MKKEKVEVFSKKEKKQKEEFRKMETTTTII